MLISEIHKRPFAFSMLFVLGLELVFPLRGHALTTGPTQPEMNNFEPAGTSDMVDPFTGDFTYNIPLLDVEGYPVNIAYHSGSGMDDEAGWTGFGWTLSPGVINRRMRGLPDDFNGAGNDGDKIVREFHLRNDITAGLNFNLSPELFGFNSGQLLQTGVQAGLFYNNKRGLGIELGLQASAPLLSGNSAAAGTQTAALSASASLSLNSQEGASFNPNINYAITGKQLSDAERNTAILSLGGSLRSRAGLQSLTLAAAFRTERTYGESMRLRNNGGTFASSSLSFAGPSFLPEMQCNFFNESFAVSPQFGPEAWGLFAGLQLTGHYSMQKVANPVTVYPAYGFMNSAQAKNDARGIMDFNREKDVPYFDGVPDLSIPVATPDIFMVSAQDGSAQYRAYPGSAGIFSDHESSNLSVSGAVGAEIGVGAGFKTGADVQVSLTKTITGKWKSGNRLLFDDRNAFDAYGNFTGSGNTSMPGFESMYIKRVGEQVPDRGSIFGLVRGALAIHPKTSGNTRGPVAEAAFTDGFSGTVSITDSLQRTGRASKNNLFSYLSAKETRSAGLDRSIPDYFRSSGGFLPPPNNCGAPKEFVTQPYKKDHHIGEVTITGEHGERQIYGIPAYNTYQEDVSFSVSSRQSGEDSAKGLVSYSSMDASVSNRNGQDQFFSREIIPAYAHAFLLTGMLSPDYIDLKGDGITDDDPGTAVKFNYWRKTDQFQWRTPYAAGKANFNEGLQSDPTDDRGNYSYGTKELWYLHSIESRNMVAVFETSDREDGMGADKTGNIDKRPATRQQLLKTIRLYAKADWNQHHGEAQPLKTVHFVYDYSLFSDPLSVSGGVPNNTEAQQIDTLTTRGNQGGKLTLKKIYFTYGGQEQEASGGYAFDYAVNFPYAWKKYDRWGNFRKSQDPEFSFLSNDIFPYASQQKGTADESARAWQLSSITTPAGGKIVVSYESDDYLFVQNKRAMQMYPLAGLGDKMGQDNHYYEGNKIFVQLPAPVSSSEELRSVYFNQTVDGTENLFFNALVKLTADGKHEYVPGYAEIKNVSKDVSLADGKQDVAQIVVSKVKGEGVSRQFNPVAKAAWQFMRIHTPALLYPGYNVREDLAPLQFIKALLGAISSLAELLTPFDSRAAGKQFASEIDLRRSWVRLNASTNSSKMTNGNPFYGKLGGGSRVKELAITDEWGEMTGVDMMSASYALTYDYTMETELSTGARVRASSGVASYEPSAGNEENPFHQPIAYREPVTLGPDNVYFIDEPLCESYFPAAGVGYSRVTVRDKTADGRTGETGFTVHEYFTQKDFPVRVTRTPIDSKSFGGPGILQLLSIKKNNSRVLSQGFAAEINDMHGKPKAERVYDKGGVEISAAEFYYKTTNDNSPEKKLDNQVLVMGSDGTVTDGIVGRDIECYTDMRSQTTYTAGLNIMFNLDAIYLFFAIVPVPVVLPVPNAAYAGFRSAATVKIIQSFGLIDKVIKRKNGSSVTSQNIAWDAETGEILLTRSINAFDDPVYFLAYPAHWMYKDGMGSACINQGLVITGFSAQSGVISPSPATAWLVPGDELLVSPGVGMASRLWINNVGTEALPVLVLIDADGKPVTISGTAKIIRSGRRNLLDMNSGSLVALQNPVRNGRLDIGAFTQVLNAAAATYSDQWPVESADVLRTVQGCPPGFNTDPEGRCYQDTLVIQDPGYTVNSVAIAQQNLAYGTCGTYITAQAGAYLSGTAADPTGINKVFTPGIWQNGTSPCAASAMLEGPLNRSGISIAEKKNSNYLNEWIGIKSKVFISRNDVTTRSPDGKTGTLFLGFGAKHSIEVRIDNILVAARNRNNDNNASSPARTWRIKPITVALDQQHEIFVRVRNEDAVNSPVMGVELYNNTVNELKSSNCVKDYCLACNDCPACRVTEISSLCTPALSANTVWSTKCLIGKRFNFHADAKGTVLSDFDPVCKGTLITDEFCQPKCRITQRKYAVPADLMLCVPPTGKLINPYVAGLLGNWRLKQSFLYHTGRKIVLPFIKPGDADFAQKTDIRKSGAYDSFSPFWKVKNSAWKSVLNDLSADKNWITANEITAYNKIGQELENRDVTNKYSGAQFGYYGTKVQAIASNSAQPETGFDDFESYRYLSAGCQMPDTCNEHHFDFRARVAGNPSAITTDDKFSHTGRYSLKVTAGTTRVTLEVPVVFPSVSKLFTVTSNSTYLAAGGIRSSFSLQPGKKYLLSCWIRDMGNNLQLGPQRDYGKTGIEVHAGSQVFDAFKAGPGVEGWRKVEVVFSPGPGIGSCSIVLRPGSVTAWFDDLRIQPFDALVKTYVYDPVSQRLWAELDENNFATFYEYDEQGAVVRQKKETERGIMTVSEKRSSLRIQP